MIARMDFTLTNAEDNIAHNQLKSMIIVPIPILLSAFNGTTTIMIMILVLKSVVEMQVWESSYGQAKLWRPAWHKTKD